MYEGILVLRLKGDQPFSTSVQQVDEGLRHAVLQELRLALVDVRELTGFSRPSVAAISEMVRRWSETAQGRVKVAMVSRRDLNDPDRFGIIIARGLGFEAEVFETETAALEWLRQGAGSPGPGQSPA